MEENLVKIKNKICSSKYWPAFASGFVLCFFINLYAFTNNMLAWDGLIFYNESDGILMGRPLVPYLMSLFNKTTVPLPIGICMCFIIGLCTVYICKTLEIESKIWQAVVASLIILNPATISGFLYYGSIYIFTAALLLATLSVYLFDKSKYGPIFSALCIFGMLCCYQAYICWVLCLMIIKLIQEMLITDEKSKQIIVKGIKYVTTVIVAMVAYYLFWQLNIKNSGLQSTTYRGYDNLVGSLTQQFWDKLGYIYYISTVEAITTNSFELPKVAYIIYYVMSFSGILLTYVNIKKKWDKLTLTTLLFGVTPLAMSFLVVVNPGAPMNMLSKFTWMFVPQILFVLNIGIYEKTHRNKIPFVCLILSIVFAWNLTIVANEFYLGIKAGYDNSISFCTRLIDRIEQSEYYKIAGDDEEPQKVAFIEGDNVYKEESAISKFGFKYNSAEGSCWAATTFIKNELNSTLNIVSLNNSEYAEYEEVLQLECFPSKNCMTLIDDVIVVKIPTSQDDYFNNESGNGYSNEE